MSETVPDKRIAEHEKRIRDARREGDTEQAAEALKASGISEEDIPF